MLRALREKLFGPPPKEEDPEYEHDLFEYSELTAGGQHPAVQRSVAHQVKQQKPRPLFWILAVIALLVAALLGFLGGRCIGDRDLDVGRKATVGFFDSRSTPKGTLHFMNRAGISFQTKGTPAPEFLPWKRVRWIQFDKPPEEKVEKPEEKEKSDRKLTDDEKRFLGRYRIVAGGHRGTLWFFKTKKGYLGGSVRFSNWGRGRYESLYGIWVRGRYIQFRRSCSGAYCRTLGSPTTFRQKYAGTIDVGLRTINGTYTGSHSGSRWKAVRY